MGDTSRDPKYLHPVLQSRWRHLGREWRRLYPDRPQPFLTATYRGPNDQEKAYREGKSKVRFGGSLHNYNPSYAFDIAFLNEKTGAAVWDWELFADAADILKPLGLEWGGDWEGFPDGPHFQMPVSVAEASEGDDPDMPEFVGDEIRSTASPATSADAGCSDDDEAVNKLVVLIDGKVTMVKELPMDVDVVVRYAPGRRRIYVDARREEE